MEEDEELACVLFFLLFSSGSTRTEEQHERLIGRNLSGQREGEGRGRSLGERETAATSPAHVHRGGFS